MNIEFAGKTVLVTGAAHGFGRAIALAFAANGAKVYACDVNEAGLAETARLDARLETFLLDVGDREAVQKAVAGRDHRHPRQQRRRRARPGRPADRGDQCRRLADDLRRQSVGRLLHDPGGGARHEGEEMGTRCQHLLWRGLGHFA